MESRVPVLLIEPSELDLNRYRSALGPLGFEVIEADSCASAIREANALRLRPVRAVVMEMVLPDGGWCDLLENLCLLLPEARKVIVTAFGSIASAIHAIRSGADDFVPKPISRAGLEK